MVIAGADTDPEWAALDLCAQAEHGAEGPLVAVAVEEAVLDAVGAAASAPPPSVPASATRRWPWSQVPDLDDAIDLANAFAPEHLELLEEDAALLAGRSTTAGCVFAGRHSATAFGDYVAGSNHVLPTGGAGRFSGPLGPGVFRRRIATVEVPAAAAAKLAPHVDALARAEGFPVHGESAMIRARTMSRTATRERSTAETQIQLSLDLDGGESSAATGVGFLDHMLDLLARHGRLGLRVEASGDLETGAHHTVEDVGIVLGQALDEALGDRAGIRRYGSALVPMDESLAECAIDISGRPLCVFDAELPATSIAGFDTELAEEFFRAVANSAKLTLHVSVRYGTNAHHMIEACFKAFARALRVAVSVDPEESGVPSTKGTLSE